MAVLRRQAAESRQLLGDYLKLYQIHSATLESGVLTNEAVLTELARLRREEGMAIGLSLSGPQQGDTLRRALAVCDADGAPLFDAVQATWNLLEPSAAPALAEAKAAGLFVIIKEAAHDGRLEEVAGFGPRRVEAVQATLAGLLSRSAARRSRQRMSGDREKPSDNRPPVSLLLELDADYRRRAEAGELKQIAPHRFNPQNEVWLPIMHAGRDGWSFTLLFSNTARAHQLGMTGDWVVIYYERDGREQQNTVVTQKTGPLAGKRVARGREPECRRYYGLE